MEIETQATVTSKFLIPGISNGVVLVVILPYFTEQDLRKLAQTSKSLQKKVQEIFKKHYSRTLPNLIIVPSPLTDNPLSDHQDNCISYLAYHLLLLKIQNSHSFHSKKWFSQDLLESLDPTSSYLSTLERIIDKTFLPAKAAYLKGVLAEMRSDPANAWIYYSKSSYKLAQQRASKAILNEELGLKEPSKEKKFEALSKLAREGNPFAQENVIFAIYKGRLGQDKRAEQDRLQDIIKLVSQGELIAKNAFAEILYNGDFGQMKRPEEERLEEIKKLAEEGVIKATELLAKAMYSGSFGFIIKSKEERMSELYEMARKGNKAAAACVVDNLESGGFGLMNKSENERFEEIKRFAEQGDKFAQQKVIHILFKGSLGQNHRSLEERFEEMVELFVKGNRYAELSVPLSVYRGTYGQNSLSEIERYERLVKLKEMGNKPAETYLALWKDGRTTEEMFDRLLSVALKGNLHAQERLLDALGTEEIGQSDNTPQFGRLYFELLNEIINVKRD